MAGDRPRGPPGIAGNLAGRTRTIALSVYALLVSPDGDAQARIPAYTSLLPSFVALAAFERLNRRQRRRLDLA